MLLGDNLLFLLYFCDEGNISGIIGGRCGREDKTQWGEGDFRYFVRRI